VDCRTKVVRANVKFIAKAILCSVPDGHLILCFFDHCHLWNRHHTTCTALDADELRKEQEAKDNAERQEDRGG
jgi:hypothetical protein